MKVKIGEPVGRNMRSNFITAIKKSWRTQNSLLCIGLDPEFEKIPSFLRKERNVIVAFNKAIIDATHDLVCAYKPQYAFYGANGVEGIDSLIKTVDYIHRKYPHIPVILDAKRGDIGNTASQYAKEVFDIYKVDAVTINPYLGFDSIEPLLERREKGIIILCRTSNPGASDFQDLKIKGTPLYKLVAKKVVLWNKKYGNCLMVTGATWPRQLKDIRRLALEMPFLVPGIGAQGGDVEKTVKAGQDKYGEGMIINSSRGIIYASDERDFAQKAREAAKKLRDEINKYRNTHD